MTPAIRVTIVTVGALLVFGFMALLAWGLANKSPVTGMSGFTRVNQPAPDFALPLFDGATTTLADYRGKPLVINFWASWCGPCRDEARALEQTWRKYRDRGVVFLGPNIQDADRSARSYIAEFGITYPNGRDAQGRMAIDYGVVGMPVTFFVNAEGIVVRRYVGAMPQTILDQWVGELAAGVSPSGATEGANPEGFREIE
ncbi:MAG: TlpA family protein disulfide reductase [SAR202 cluster bacterium]|nr:TlpA family protein disulfide reductase [SAR202 cluster bacterium]